MHHRDNLDGTVRDPAWYTALLQVSIGVIGLMYFLLIVWEEISGMRSGVGSSNKYISSLVLIVMISSILYYLLFKVYKVSKETGLTEKYYFVVTQKIKIFFWAFWILSIFGTFIFGYVVRDLGLFSV
ncbi:hypothetical protein [Dyadobacter frigoris]|uniref:Uncharacterized protein n=1 Tax=Dyadobacter frigoris TaxID=2576211 RepID=A0A4U6D511_9BACT|nr:hypothetical protein [Dyadobacter frigoris]TKT91786.1 hypothetical protein FDK13_11540 [Dyadobacter frigoris]GLU55566.1 hypothetical protein Dfri01_50270 [Dyadobacter frigoris]